MGTQSHSCWQGKLKIKMNISLAKKEEIFQIARIHKEEIKESFLGSLPVGFLTQLHKAIISSSHSFCIVIKENNAVMGFVSGVTDMDAFYKYFFRHYFFGSFAILFPKIFSISFIKKAIENILYPKKMDALPSAELLIIAIKKEFQGQGFGGKLLTDLIGEFKKRQIKTFKVLVGKDLHAVDFYKKNNFEQIKEINLHSGETSLVFIYKIE